MPAKSIREHSHGDAPRLCPGQRLEKRFSGRIEDKDVELHVHVAGRRLDLRDHGIEGAVVVGQELGAVAVDHGERPQVAVQCHHRMQPLGPVEALADQRAPLRPRQDQVIDLPLFVAAGLGQLRVSNKEIRDCTEQRYENNGKHPGNRRRRAAVHGYEDSCHGHQENMGRQREQSDGLGVAQKFAHWHLGPFSRGNWRLSFG